MYMAEVWQQATELHKNIHLHYSVEYASIKILSSSSAIMLQSHDWNSHFLKGGMSDSWPRGQPDF